MTKRRTIRVIRATRPPGKKSKPVKDDFRWNPHYEPSKEDTDAIAALQD